MSFTSIWINILFFPWTWISRNTGFTVIIAAYSCTVGAISSTEQNGPHWSEFLMDLNQFKNVMDKSLKWINYSVNNLTLYSAGIPESIECYEYALQCYLIEAEMAAEQVHFLLSNASGQMMIEHLKSYYDTQKHAKQWVTCKKCEEYQEKPFAQFISEFVNLIHMFNDRNIRFT